MPETAPADGSTTFVSVAADRKAAATQRTFVLAAAAVLGFVVLFVVVVVVPGLSALFVWLLPSAALAAGAYLTARRGLVSLLVRAPRADRRALGYTRAIADGPLAPGHVVLRGRVAYAEGASQAMQVDLVEWGAERRDKSGWSHSWTEESRRLTVRPFYLVRDDRTRIRIEPDARTSQLFDDLEWKVDPIVEGDPPRRTRVARLDPDEEIWAIGELTEGDDPEAANAAEPVDYRQSARPTTLLLRAAPALLVSSVPLVDHFRARARLHRMQGVIALLSLVFPLLLAARFVDRARGHTAQGIVEECVVDRGKHNTITGFHAYVLADGAEWESAELDESVEKGAAFPLRLGHYSSNDGPGVKWTTGERVMSVVILLGLLVAAVNAKQRSQRQLPWFRWSGDFVEGGQGRLRDS